jgi:cobalt-zinc-cadmium efflux system protein
MTDYDESRAKEINLIVAMFLKFIIAASNVVGGLSSGSLSLISGALHYLSDALAIFVSYFAIKMSQKSNDESKTFGYKRYTILAAVINCTVLIVISVLLLREAYFKFITPAKINGAVVIWVSLLALLANALGAYLLHKFSIRDINMKAIYLDLLSDAMTATVVIVGGIVIYYFNVNWVDPLLTVIIALYVLKESCKILRQGIIILVQGTPENIKIDEIVEELEKIEAIENIHHIHVWALNEDTVFFEAHVNLRKDILISETLKVHDRIEHELKDHYGIKHITIQFEINGCEDVGIINEKDAMEE